MSDYNQNNPNNQNDQNYQQMPPQQQGYYPQQPPQPPQSQQPKASGQGIASMVLGIVSLVLSCIVYLSIPCAVIGLVLGIVALKKPGPQGMAKAGIVMTIIGIALTVIWLILAALSVAAFDSFFYEYFY